MSGEHRKTRIAKIAFIWLSIGSIITAPIWLSTRVSFLPLTWFGPLTVMAFKPAENVLGKIFLAGLLSLPTLVGGGLIARRWSEWSSVRRILAVILLSILWHVPTTLMWIAILNGFN